MRRAAAAVLAALLLAALPAAAPRPAGADEVADRQAEVDRLQADVDRLQAEVARLERAGADAAARLRVLDARWRQAAKQVALHQAQLRLVHRRLETERREVARLREDLGKRRARLGRRAAALFQRTRTAEYEVLASADDLVDYRRRVRFLEAVARADAEMIARTIRAKEAVEKAVERLAKRKAEMDRVHADLRRAEGAERRARVAAQEAKNRFDRDTQAARRRRDEAVRNLSSLRSLVGQLQRRAGRIAGVAARGRLQPPVPGEAFVPPELADVLGGVYLRAPAGTPVVAAAPGKVIHAGTLRGFGTTVILGHADGIVTVYGNLSGADVAAGREVAAGARLGRSGLSQYGPAIFFAVRSGNVAQNPLEWISR